MIFAPPTDNGVETGESQRKDTHPLSVTLTSSREGKISRIGMIPGTLYILENESQRTYGVNLHTMPTYRGETLKELGFKVGAPVRFHTAEDQQTVTAAQAVR